MIFSKAAFLASTLLASLTPAIAELETVKLSHPSGSSAEIFLFGAHVKSFRAAINPTQDVLFMSEKSFLDGVHPFRGGIPVVFPNFGEPPGFPNHGFARITKWALNSSRLATDPNSPYNCIACYPINAEYTRRYSAAILR